MDKPLAKPGKFPGVERIPYPVDNATHARYLCHIWMIGQPNLKAKTRCPAQAGLPWRITLIRRLLDAFGERVAGLKDSSGDMDFANEAADLSPHFQVFSATEAALPQARAGRFAGCISATANLNADLCARFYRSDDSAALAQAIAIRKLFDGKPLVPGVKALLAHIHGEPQWVRVAPPLLPLAAADRMAAIAGYEAVRAKRVV